MGWLSNAGSNRIRARDEAEIVICAPDADTVIVSIAAVRIVIFACIAALGVAFLAVIGSIEHDPGPPPRIR